MPQEIFPYNFQVNVPSSCQSVFQVPSQLNSKEGTTLKCQSDFQVPIQGSHQLILQIYPRKDPRVFTLNMPSIMPDSPVFIESSGDTSGSTSDNTTKDPSRVPIIKTASAPSENQTIDPFRVPELIFKWQSKQHYNWISKCRYNRRYQNHANCKSNFKS